MQVTCINRNNHYSRFIKQGEFMKLLLTLLLTLPTLAYSHSNQQTNLQLINWFAGADIVGTSGDSESDQHSDFYVREFEFSAYSAIDQTWDGVLTLAYHKESTSDEEHIEVHEAFLSSSKLFKLANFKIGKFFLGFGRLNRFHRHDWTFTEAPLVQKSFFGNEGAKDTGIEYKKNLPSLMSSVTLGLTKGDEFNHNHAHDDEETTEIEKANSPTAYLRYAKFYEFTTTRGLEIAANYIHRVDAENIKYNYAGIDLIYKNRTGNFVKTLIQSEIWSRKQVHNEDGAEESFNDIGGYLYIEKGIDRHNAYSFRFDYYKADSHEEEADHDHGIDGLEVDGEFKAVSIGYIHTNSEFMKTRFTLETAEGIKLDTDASVDSYTKLMIQFVFSIGAHPAHVF
ncbi:MAG: hypothetical protein ACI9QD_000430 [Thermoproteota archaeon]|jgi:hypothetical protein